MTEAKAEVNKENRKKERKLVPSNRSSKITSESEEWKRRASSRTCNIIKSSLLWDWFPIWAKNAVDWNNFETDFLSYRNGSKTQPIIFALIAVMPSMTGIE